MPRWGGPALERQWLLPAFGCATLLGTVWLGVGSVEGGEMEARAGRTDVSSASLQRVAIWATDQGNENVLRMLAISIRASPEAEAPRATPAVLGELTHDPVPQVAQAATQALHRCPVDDGGGR